MKASTVTTVREKLSHVIEDNRVAILVWAIETLFGNLHSQIIYMYVSPLCMYMYMYTTLGSDEVVYLYMYIVFFNVCKCKYEYTI